MSEVLDWTLNMQSYLDSSFGDANGLLLHSFMDGHLVFEVHLVKLIDAAHTLETKTCSSVEVKVHNSVSSSPFFLTAETHVVRQHQSSGLDDELVRLLITDHGCRQTSGAAGLPAGVDGPGTELLHVS